MTNNVLPSKFLDYCASWRNGLTLASQIAVDQHLVDLGFSSIGGEIERDNAVFGKASYEDSIVRLLNPQNVATYRANFHDALDRAQRDSNELAPRQIGNSILSNGGLSCLEKRRLMMRFSPEYLSQLLVEHVPNLAACRDQEQTRHCGLYGDSPPIRLMASKSEVRLRKQVFNDVVKSAFGDIGFLKGRKTAGIQSMLKPLNESLAIVVSVDQKTFSQALYDYGAQYDFEKIGGVQINWDLSVCSRSKSKLSPQSRIPRVGAYTYAERIFGSFRDTLGLEVSIRAQAELYKLQAAELESAIIDA